jgi:PKD repeat protein
MAVFKSWLHCCGPLLLVVLTGCNAKSGLDGNTTQPTAPPQSNENGIAIRQLDATRNDEWVYFDLAGNAVVYPQNPANSNEWDIAFQRFKIKTNSGVSGTANVQAAALKDTAFEAVTTVPASAQYHSDRALSELTDSELIALDAGQFFAVCAIGFSCIDTANGTVDRNHLNTATAAYALLTFGSGIMHSGGTQKSILGWYDYFMDDGHVLRPAGDTWLIKTAEGIDLKLELLGYYGQGNNSEAGNIAVRYQSLSAGFTVPAAGATQLKVQASASSTHGAAPLLVQFSASVSGGTAAQWHWDFGDGSGASSMIATHSYQQPGTYVATVTVTDQRGAQNSQALSITVNPPGNQPPVANAGPDQTIQLGAGVTQVSVTLDGSASSDFDGIVSSYVWAGAPKPNDEVAPHVMLAIGRYTFTLTVADERGATASDSVEITVASPTNTPPIAVIGATITSGAAPLAVQFDSTGSADSDGSLTLYAWDFGDGSMGAGVAPAHTYTQPGHYTATLTVTDDGGAVATASKTIDATLVVPVSADTYIYEFLGNQIPSDALLVWNHESNHGARTLLDFDALDAQLGGLGAGNFSATLRLYVICELGTGGYVAGCPGEPDVGSPGGIATVSTAIRTQLGPWSENDPALVWSGVSEGPLYATFTVDGVGRWLDVDVTNLVEAWRAAGSTGYGIVLTQEAYPVVRTDHGDVAVVGLRSKEDAAHLSEHPYLEIRALH